MGRDKVSEVTYGNYTLTLRLPGSEIDKARFLATPASYQQQLRVRSDIPDGVRVLITRLFEQKAITYCSISYGSKMELRLANQTPKGKRLLTEGALKQFLEIFERITGERLDVSWEGSGGVKGRRGERDYSGILGALAHVVDVVVDGVSFAADIKILFGDDD